MATFYYSIAALTVGLLYVFYCWLWGIPFTFIFRKDRMKYLNIIFQRSSNDETDISV